MTKNETFSVFSFRIVRKLISICERPIIPTTTTTKMPKGLKSFSWSVTQRDTIHILLLCPFVDMNLNYFLLFGRINQEKIWKIRENFPVGRSKRQTAQNTQKNMKNLDQINFFLFAWRLSRVFKQNNKWKLQRNCRSWGNPTKKCFPKPKTIFRSKFAYFGQYEYLKCITNFQFKMLTHASKCNEQCYCAGFSDLSPSPI